MSRVTRTTKNTFPPGAHFDGYVVGIGASAGGLEALEQFFDHCAPDSGAAYVVVQHLSPDHKSMMNNLLSRHTRMPVQMVEDGMPVQANQVYLIPPGAVMRVSGEQFHLSPKSPHGLTLPIDIFFGSLSEAYGSRALGVVLSGTGSDGTRGAVAINAAGGFLLAQDPEQAKFDGMPRSVIATGVVDEVLPAQHLGARVLSHIQNLPYEPVRTPADVPARSEHLTESEALQSLLQLLKQTGGINFQDYKSGTVMRRIQRRMQVRHMPNLQTYLDLAEQDRAELFVLRRELLISVTSFFRDPESFELLSEKAIAQLVQQASGGSTIRVWVAGSSTGEEAYTLAMLFMEAFERERRWPSLKIFATDINQQNIDVAAQGQYPESAAVELTPARLERFFVKNGSYFVVKPELRQVIVFARHNLLEDPPFTRMDLVTCRNTLIYFRPEAQDRAQRRLQYAVKPDAYLFLGSSESLSGASTGFSTLSIKHKIFQRTAGILPLVYETTMPGPAVLAPMGKRLVNSLARTAPSDAPVVDAALSALMSAYVPPAMLVNDQHQVVHLFGDMKSFFQIREGLASLDIHRVLPDALIPSASALVFKATKDGVKLVSDVLRISIGTDEAVALRLVAQPLRLHGEERFVLLCFERLANAPAQTNEQTAVPIDVASETMARVEILERELMATRESLQATIEELETSNEELQATNEEMMASNEELQSSNEELQSVNEELNTVNAEFQEKTSILSRLNSDMDSMTKAVGVATVFVDQDLNLTRFSPDALELFKLRDSDVGRPLDDIGHRLKYPSLMEEIRRTLLTDRMQEREILAEDGRMFLCRLLPYRVPSSQQRGVVCTFVDVTVFRDLRRLQSIIDALPEHVAVLEQDGYISMVNAAWRNFARANGDSQLAHSGPGANYFDACKGGDEIGDEYARRAVRGVRAVLEGTLPFFSLQYPCHSPTEQRWFVMNVAPVSGHEFGAVVSHVNISGWYKGAVVEPNTVIAV